MAFQLAAVDNPVVGEALLAHGLVREYVEFDDAPVMVDYSGDGLVFTAAGKAEKDLARLVVAGGDDVCLCFTPDAQGVFLTWLLESFLGRQWRGGRVKKLRLAGLSPELIASALVDEQESGAAVPMAVLARRELGRKLQFHLRRTLGSGRGPGGLPLSLNAVAMVFSMADFLAVEGGGYSGYGVFAEFDAAAGVFEGRLAEMLGHTVAGVFPREEKAVACADVLATMAFTVSTVDRQTCGIEPPPPLTLAALTIAAMETFGLSPARVQLVVDCLAAGNGRTAWISPGYDACPPLEVLVEAVRAAVVAEFGADFLCRRDFPAAAILPVSGPEAGGMSLEEKEILGLINARARAWQMPPLKEEVVQVELVSVDGALVRARGRRCLAPGFATAIAGEGEDAAEPVLFTLEPGMGISIRRAGVTPETGAGGGFGLPDFWELMADMGINADRASCQTLEQLLDLDYLVLAPGAGFSLRPRFEMLLRGFSRAFPGFPPQSLLPYLEQTVHEVAEGRKRLAEAVSQFDQTLFVHGRVLVRKKSMVRVNLEQHQISRRIIKGGVEAVAPPEPFETSGEEIAPPVLEDGAMRTEAAGVPPAPLTVEEKEQAQVTEVGAETGGEGDDDGDWSVEVMAELVSPGFDSEPEPEPEPAVPAVEKTVVCIECGRSMLRQRYRYGGFWRCHDYPECRGVQDDDNMALPLCPLCGLGAVIPHRTGSGRLFYICTEDDCGLTAWSRPHAVSCRRCGHPFLVEKKKGENTILRCPRAGCGYEHKDGEAKNSASPRRRKVVVKKRGAKSGRRVVRVVRRVKR